MGHRSFYVAIAAVVALQLAAGSCRAQERARQRRYDQVIQACARDAGRLCPWINPSTPEPRTEIMCLRPYRATVSLACRRALRAAVS
jgi:hypothetical protein